MTLRASGFWSLTLGFFLLMQANQTAIPADPGKEIPLFTNQTQVAGAVDDTSGKVTVNVFESPNCGDCDIFGIHSIIPAHQLYEKNPHVMLNVYFIPESGEAAIGSELAKNLICAQKQNQFWPLYKEIHNRPEVLNSAQIAELIVEKEWEINLDTLNACLTSEETQQTLEKHQEMAKVKRIEIYPTTLIQDVQLIHNQPLENLVKVIDEKVLEMSSVEL